MTVVLQDDRFDATNPLRFAPLPPIQLKRRCFAFRSRPTIATVSMLFLDLVDKITTVPKNKLGHRIGHLDAKDMERVNQAILVFLGLIIKTSCPKCMKKIVTSAVRVRGVKGASKRAATYPKAEPARPRSNKVPSGGCCAFHTGFASIHACVSSSGVRLKSSGKSIVASENFRRPINGLVWNVIVARIHQITD
ncbi:MAG: type II toxin-antitoxin system PemK/MazF family toxin [Xanthobacteraceae bacterium]